MKKGFTLIELLAVIIILAIVALIATPIILNVISDARASAGRSEANMIYSGINNYCATSAMGNQLNDKTDICADGVLIEEIPQMVNLGNAKVTSVSYSDGKVTSLVVESNNHTFKLCGDGSFVMDEEECGVAPEDPDVGLVKASISDTVLTRFPELATTGNGCTTPGDNNYSYMGGCYIKGNPSNNYIWYSEFLWRIMGINADGSIRLVTDDFVTSIVYDEGSSNWDNSYVKQWLNNDFYSQLMKTDIIVEQIWCNETTTSSSDRTTCTNNLSIEPAKVGLITLDEYNLSGAGNSYLEGDAYQWTMTPASDSRIWRVFSVLGYSRTDLDFPENLRAVINISPDTIINVNDGTSELPYELN